jgi:hypothetical protein
MATLFLSHGAPTLAIEPPPRAKALCRKPGPDRRK